MPPPRPLAPPWLRRPRSHRPGRVVGARGLGLALADRSPAVLALSASGPGPLPIVTMISQRAAMDCGVVSLAMLLAKSYEDVFAAAILANRHPPHRLGMDVADIQRTAKRLGVTLRRRRRFDLDEACGILGVAKIDPQASADPEHVLLLKAGLVFDTDGMVWEPLTYFARHRYRPIVLLVLA